METLPGDLVMPSLSKNQHAAMCAAEKGKSTLGIPQDVGAEFCHADKGRVKNLPKKKLRNTGKGK
jgi:hypothetical protein